ncbi:MAG: 3-ketoacyl-ACP synthase [Myxococcales bacterium]|nr:3-ketoacyl-ACP synthase [Myxococcales bacterium]
MGNEKIAKAIPGWPAEKIEEKTGIRERRFLWDIDAEKGVAIPPPEDASFYPACNTDMCEVALKRALEMAELDPWELDGLFLVTCAPDELNFSHDAMQLHARLGLRPDAFALVVDDGCGGTPYILDMVQRMISRGAYGTVAVIGSSFASPYVNREVFTQELFPAPGKKPLNAYLSMYVFGDGAGAVVLRGEEEGGQGILSSMSGNASGELVLRRGLGSLKLGFQGRSSLAEMAFVVDGPEVARSYPIYMKACIESVLSAHPELASEVRRYYLHQPNKRLMDHFIAQAGLDPERVACHVDRHGNTSAAGMLILLSEDLEAGTVRIGGGDLVLLAAVGANVHYGAQLVRL